MLTRISRRTRDRLTNTILASLAPFAFGSVAEAQETTQPDDVSETIVIIGRTGESSLSFESRHGLDEDLVADLRSSSLDEIIGKLPSAHVPTNSRGESILFLRNAAERQVSVFYEGASINIPWDNRLDLNLFPAGLVGSLRSAAGPLAPHYGVNALGAVNLMPREARREGEVAAMIGTAELHDVRAILSLPVSDSVGFSVGGSYASHEGEPLGDRSRLPFSQPGIELRTNTDHELISLFGRMRADLSGHRLSLTLFHVDAEKGIAPESDRPSGARFWRYPVINHTLAVASLHSPLGGSTTLDSAIWFQKFNQTIDAFTNVSYSARSAREVNRDETFGIRELLAHDSGPWRFVASANFLQSTHDQQDISFVAGQLPAVLPPVLLYKQRNWSVGGEIEYRATANLIAELGLGYDRVDYLKTGDKPPMRDIGSWTGRAGLIWTNDNGLRLRASIARKIRTPTMRELFGQALNRFLLNPDLQPEKIITAELGAEWNGRKGGLFVIPFYQHLKNTIEQRNVGQLRQRINLVGSKVAGVEVGGRYDLAEHLQLYGSATYAAARRRGTTPGQTRKLAEKPDLIARVGLAYAPPTGFRATVEAEHVGSAYSANAAGTLVPLEKSTSLNLRLAWRFALNPGQAELFLNVDNATDTYIEPQVGLPAPGRWVRGGFRLGF